MRESNHYPIDTPDRFVAYCFVAYGPLRTLASLGSGLTCDRTSCVLALACRLCFGAPQRGRMKLTWSVLVRLHTKSRTVTLKLLTPAPRASTPSIFCDALLRDNRKHCALATGAFQSECGPISTPARRKTQPNTSKFGFFPAVGTLASSDVGYTAQ